MTSPFRSALSTQARRRAHPVVERSTFVVAQCGAHLLAVPVECVLRVVRAGGDHVPVPFDGTMLPLTALDLAPRPVSEGHAANHARLLILRAHATAAPHLAGRVDTVLDVLAVETALVRPRSAVTGEVPPHPAVRGMFLRMDTPVWVVDPARFPPAS